MRHEEHEQQSAFFEYVDLYATKDARYLNIFAVPNGELRELHTAARLKKEGVRRGVLDVVVAVPSGPWHGMFIEFKSQKGKLSEHQKGWAERLTRAGYAVIVARDAVQAIHAVKMYFLQPGNLIEVEIQKTIKG